MSRPSLLLRRIGVPPLDAVIALAMTALLQAELWLGERYQGAAAIPGARAVNAPLLAVAALALAFRRRSPLRAFAVAMAALSAESLISGGPENAGGFALLLVATYSAAAYGDRSLATAAIAVATLVIHDLTDPFVEGVGDVLFAAIFAGVGFLIGRAMHGRRLRSWVLAEEAARMQADLEARTQEAVAEERERIARELHDIIAHSVSLMVVQAIAGQRAAAENGTAARDALASIEAAGRQAMGEMRRLLALLHESPDASTEPQPGLAELPRLVADVERAGLQVQLVERGERPALSAGVQLALYRIAQEALTNALKHAGPTRVEVELDYEGPAVGLCVRDHGGAGLHDGAHWAGGKGLPGMRERAEVYGGRLQAGPTGDGFAVHVELPVGQAPA